MLEMTRFEMNVIGNPDAFPVLSEMHKQYCGSTLSMDMDIDMAIKAMKETLMVYLSDHTQDDFWKLVKTKA